jgi:predicted metal-dependent HD superfamily phosphohydrolase
LTATRRAPPPAWFEQLTALYNEPHRHYHNALHIADCLAEFDRAHHLASNPVAVEFAIWFHDARYEPRASDNEERSADLATDWLSRQGASDVLADAVRRLVLATKAHDTGVCPDAPLMVDVDLSILGAAPDRFWEYERQIRAEYAWVDDRVFAVKRAEILESFLTRPRIYSTRDFFDRLETRARANLAASICRLQQM